MYGITWLFAFFPFPQLGIPLQHFGILTHILGALGVFKHNDDRILALANRFVNLPFCTTPLTNNLLYVMNALGVNFVVSNIVRIAQTI